MRLGITWTDAATVVVSTIGIYLGFLVLIKLVGQRAVASMSSFDFAAAIALGAVMGRTVAGYTPTLAALHHNLRRAQIAEDELREKLRLAGIHRYADVAAVILERAGGISVLRQGERLAPQMLEDVRGAEAVGGRHLDT